MDTIKTIENDSALVKTVVTDLTKISDTIVDDLEEGIHKVTTFVTNVFVDLKAIEEKLGLVDLVCVLIGTLTLILSIIAPIYFLSSISIDTKNELY